MTSHRRRPPSDRPTKRHAHRHNSAFTHAARTRNASENPTGTSPTTPSKEDFWLYGHHTVFHALRNPRRRCHELLTLADSELVQQRPQKCSHRIVDKQTFATILGNQAVHQGVALRVSPLPEHTLEDHISTLTPQARFIILDQITDPHNVGAILRSSAAFGVTAMITTRRHSPQNMGTLAKAASGALEYIPMIAVTNLARTLESLKHAGVWCYGLDGEGPQSLHGVGTHAPIALVLGAEGDGLRRLTRAHCDALVRISTCGSLHSLNVSNAAAIALYAIQPTTTPPAASSAKNAR